MARHGICWTFNNYTPETLIKARGAVGVAGIKYICWGIEVGEQGTPHLQGYMQVNHDKYARLQKVMGTCHMEKQKGDSKQAVDYCKKDGDFSEFGVYEHIDSPKSRQGKRTDHDEVFKMVKEGKTYQEIVEANSGYAAKYGRFIREQVGVAREEAGKASLLLEYEGVSWKPWQKDVLDTVEGTADKRTIHWIWENQGNVGKSYLATYLKLTRGALVMESGKKMDMAFIFAQDPAEIVIINLSRTSAPVDGKDYLSGVYSLCENLKDGMVMSAKYESKVVAFKVPHVFIFANWEPDYTKWSADRYNVINIGPSFDYSAPA